VQHPELRLQKYEDSPGFCYASGVPLICANRVFARNCFAGKQFRRPQTLRPWSAAMN
jgi:hypothetical protein